jgi:hypothetical protein
VEEAGGSIALETSKEQGTTITIDIPKPRQTDHDETRRSGGDRAFSGGSVL